MFRRLLISAALLSIAAPVAAFAHEEPDLYQHEQDHQEHGAFHDEADAAHAQAHEEGFANEAEHQSYHRAMREMHDNFHDDHRGTRHDGYRLPPSRSYGYGYPPYGYGGDYGYRSYGYSPGYYYQEPSMSLFFGFGR